MKTEIGQLEYGETYANRSRIVVRKETDFILIKRIQDDWLTAFDSTHPSWRHKVHKDVTKTR